MKTAVTLKKYLKKRLGSIDALLKKPARLFTINDFHQLRVELKKLNAIFGLVNFCVPAFKRKTTFHPFKAVFNRSGKVREMQLEEAVLKKLIPHYSFSAYLSSLTHALAKAQTDFFSLTTREEKLKLKRVGKIITALVSDVKKKQVDRFIKHEKKKIKLLLNNKKLHVQQVHKLRKLLKDFYYNCKSLDLPKQIMPFKKIHALQELMGKWHDARVMAVHIKKAISSRQTAAEETADLKKIKERFYATAESLLVKINHTKRYVDL